MPDVSFDDLIPATSQPPAAAGDLNFDDLVPKVDPAIAARQADMGLGRKLNAGVRGAEDALTFGFGDEINGALAATPQLANGWDAYTTARDADIKHDREIQKLDEQQVPVSRGIGEVAGMLGGIGVGGAVDVASSVPRLIRAGPAIARFGEDVVRGMGAGSVYGGLTAAGNAEGDAGQRLAAAGPGAAMGAVVGGAAVPVAAVAGAGVNALARRFQPQIDRAANALDGRFDLHTAVQRADELRGLGLDPSAINVMDDAGRGFVRDAASRMTPAREVVQNRADAAVAALPSRIGAQAHTVMGDDPRSITDLQAGIDSRIADASTPPDTSYGDAGSQVHTRLNASYDAAKSWVDDAYNDARAAAPNAAHLPQEERPDLNASLRDAVRDYPMQHLPRVSGVLTGLDGTGPMNVRDLFDARTQLSNLRRSSDPVEGAAAGRLVGAIDQNLNDAADRGAITGDPTVVGRWQDAIARRRSFGQLYEGDDLINNLTSRGWRGGAQVNDVAPEDASAAIFGRGASVANRPNLTRDLSRLRDRLGADSPEWQAVQNEGLSRILGRDAGSENYGQAWDRFSAQNPELAQVLLSGDQRSAMTAARNNIQGAVSDRNALQVGGSFMRPGSADEFTSGVNALDPARLQLARLAAVRDIEQRAGESVGAAPGVARRLSLAPEQQARSAALLGPESAVDLQTRMAAEARNVRDITDVAPRTGPQSANRMLDALRGNEGAGAVVEAAQTAVQPQTWLPKLVSAFTKAGISAKDAEAVASIATDPAQLDGLISRMEQRRPGSGQAIRAIINQTLGRKAGEITARQPTVEAMVVGHPETYAASYGPAGGH